MTNKQALDALDKLARIAFMNTSNEKHSVEEHVYLTEIIRTTLTNQEPVNKTLLDALKYARRFLTPEQHDTNFIDDAIAAASSAPVDKPSPSDQVEVVEGLEEAVSIEGLPSNTNEDCEVYLARCDDYKKVYGRSVYETLMIAAHLQLERKNKAEVDSVSGTKAGE